MSKLYKYMSCPACNCSTCTRSGEVYECQACYEQWQMVTSNEKNNKQKQHNIIYNPDDEIICFAGDLPNYIAKHKKSDIDELIDNLLDDPERNKTAIKKLVKDLVTDKPELIDKLKEISK